MNPLIRISVDSDIRSGLSNFRILEKLKDVIKVPEEIVPSNDQLTNRRFYLKTIITGDLAKNTKGGFIKWKEENSVEFSSALPHDLIVLKYFLDENDFMMLVSTPSLLRNCVKQANGTNRSFLALDATHKLISCGFLFSTFATCTMDQEIADIGYMIHAKENTETYVFGLTALKEGLKKHLDFDYNPKVFVLFFFTY